MSKRKIIFIAAICICILIAALLIWNLDVFNWQKLDISRIYSMQLSTRLLDCRSEEYAVLSGGVHRTYTCLEEIPEYVHEAFVAAEDVRFYEHCGVDMRRIFGAAISNLKSGSYAQGASTITQQLIKLTHLTSEKTLARKAQEAWLALQLENKLSKAEILEAYINTVYFGGGAYGIAAASVRYFSKQPSELTVSESAMLAGIIKSPTNYAPHNNMKKAIERRDYVLRAMRDAGFITEAEFDNAINSEIELNEEKSGSMQFGWYTDSAVLEACEILDIDTEQLLGGGYTIYTALDSEMQTAAQYEMTSDDSYPEEGAQGAFVAIEPQSGKVRAIVGGRDYETVFGFNRALSACRQPGSLIKPISTYAAAVENHEYVPSSMVYDIRREYDDGYMPGNAGSSYYGETIMRTAISKSLNAATVDLADTIGIDEITAMAEGFGIAVTDTDKNLAFALGAMTYGATPMQMCGAYAAIANNGVYCRPYFVEKIIDRYGEVIYERQPERKRVISAISAAILTSMLETAATEGTASSLRELGIPVAAKTGTSGTGDGDTSDAWAAAYTPDIAVTVWIGKDDNSEGGMAKSVSGSGYAVPICRKFLESVKPKLSGEGFGIPEGLSVVLIDKFALDNEKRLALASASTPSQYVSQEVFRDTPQLEVSDIWEIPCAVNDLLLISEAGDTPVMEFSGNNRYADYLIIRKSEGKSEIAGVAHCEYGEKVRFADTGADVGTNNSYTVIPRHRLFYDIGITLTGEESPQITAPAGGLLNRITGMVFGDELNHEIETVIDPMF